MNDEKRQAVITGIGLVSPLGADRDASWRALINGLSGVRSTGAFAPVDETVVPSLMSRFPLPPASGADAGAGWTGIPRTVILALRAARESWEDARLDEVAPERLSCVVSSSKPVMDAGGDIFCHPPEVVPTAVARQAGAGGMVLNISSACATGAQSLLTAAGWIEEGRADVVLAGAAESALHPLYLAGFKKLRVLSEAGLVRPFDRGRDGFVVGEGAAVFILESLAGARARGAKIYGRVAGGNFSSDAHHATRFNSNGRTMAACLQKALAQAELSATDLDYVNAHGTATVLNDFLETQALTSLFPKNPPPVSSTKGATGHLLGATGAVEIAFSLLAMRDGVLPPTLNMETPETDLLDFVPNHARSAKLNHVASLSFGFGGTLAAVILEGSS